MRLLINDVATFMLATGQLARRFMRPALADRQTAKLRIALLREEVGELERAIEAGDLVEIADGIADVIYIAIGTALAYGIPLDLVWREVHRSNMAKVGKDGKVHKAPNGKIVKPEGWRPPNIAAILAAVTKTGEQ